MLNAKSIISLHSSSLSLQPSLDQHKTTMAFLQRLINLAGISLVTYQVGVVVYPTIELTINRWLYEYRKMAFVASVSPFALTCSRKELCEFITPKSAIVIGCTDDLRRRIEHHHAEWGTVPSDVMVKWMYSEHTEWDTDDLLLEIVKKDAFLVDKFTTQPEKGRGAVYVIKFVRKEVADKLTN